MAKTDNFFMEFYLFWRGIFRGNDKMTSVFSFDGILNRPLAWATAIVLHLIMQVAGWLNIEVFTYIFGLAVFYCILALLQKRCRDFGSTGTFWIIFVSILMLTESILYFLNRNGLGIIYPEWQQVERFSYCLLIVPLLMPSKPAPDLKLRSPLLKHPLLYTIICGMFVILATMAVNHFAGN